MLSKKEYKEISSLRFVLAEFKKITNFRQVVRLAAFGKVFDITHPHQCRINLGAKTDVMYILLKCTRMLRRKKDFHSLYRYLESKIKQIHGIGDLYVYDLAMRIGVNLGIYPKYIYLHRGSKDGARSINLDCSKGYVTIDEVPKWLRKFKSYEIEDVLCIIKDY